MSQDRSTLHVRGEAPLPPDTEGIHRIANTERLDRLADVVFVHGLGGASHSTWTHGTRGQPGHFFWPEQLGKKVPQCGVWSVGYGAGITEFGNPGMAIGERGLSLGSQLRLADIGTERPVIFVTHSMGGLVIKAMIDGCRQHVDPRLEGLVRWTKGIVFCGTPHRGSSFASAAKLLSDYFEWAAQEHLLEMVTNAKGLELLHGRFLGWLRSNPIQIHCFTETQALGKPSRLFRGPLALGIVVPGSSAVIDCHLQTPFQADHLSLVKPDSSRSHAYLALLDYLRTALPDLIPLP